MGQFTLSKASDEPKPTTSLDSPGGFARVTTLAVNRCALILLAGRRFIEALIQHVGLRRPWREPWTTERSCGGRAVEFPFAFVIDSCLMQVVVEIKLLTFRT